MSSIGWRLQEVNGFEQAIKVIQGIANFDAPDHQHSGEDKESGIDQREGGQV